ncbi:Protein CBG07076 [Caenorhabditis briggsae]|uniref:Uncharacterized protein n=2 Tax=Caenorhabditis briggsae TaxID=6238 RepID=A0AAE9IWL8_CAEBR|nr:Protein CBG07076 [Caenorhabditis briggsae]ULU08884.1 hypothetical protein L3Y34_019836 [Caenorhabditis briggsae]UMM20784.1 hypothetical protein L5515_015925 [Caenorhabditis briggsae]CAP27276.1 Protein CBG07076 [Caenorhabditis briggsae]
MPQNLMNPDHLRNLSRRLLRILCGRRLPQTWNTVLVLLSIHMYLTVPVILAAGINNDRTGLLRPFREIQQRGILLGEIDDDVLDLFYERCHAERM